MNLRACLSCLSLMTLGLMATVALADEPDKKPELREVKVNDITLKVPESWKKTEPTGAAARLRLAQFEIPAAEGEDGTVELVVSSFGGGGGGLQDNLPRWVGEFNQQGRKITVTTGKSTQGDYSIVEVSGTHVGPGFNRRAEPLKDARLVAMMLNVPEKGVYFLKVSGPEKTVAAAGDSLRTAIGADKKAEKPYRPDAE